MTKNLKRLLTVSACLLASLALIAGCGDDEETDGGGGGGETTEVSSDATPSEVYQAFNAAVASGDEDTACGLLAPAGIKQVEQASIGGTCEDWVGEVEGVLTPQYKKAMENAQVKDEQIQGETATLEVKDPVLQLQLEVELEQIDGTWKLSKLSSFV
jgi:hypothetical protein